MSDVFPPRTGARRNQYRWLIPALVWLFLALAATLWLQKPARAESGDAGTDAADAPVCTTSAPASNAYSMTVCIAAPDNGAGVSGLQTISATVTPGSSSYPGTAKLIFSLDGNYLLTDYEAPYTFQLPSYTFSNGWHTLSVTTEVRGGFVAAGPAIQVNFSNTGEPPSGPDFTPHTVPAPPPGQSVTVAVHGDGAGGENAAARVAQLVESWNPAFVLYLGDVYEQGTYTEMLNWYGFPGPAGTFFGRLYDITNPIVGNHEYLTPHAEGYFKYWNNIPPYYSYDAGGWHFIALNSTEEFGPILASQQLAWLQDEVAANTNPCTIAYFHHPVLSVGPQEGDAVPLGDIWQLLAQDGVDMAFTGHDHSYQRWKPLDANLNVSPQGITQFVVGNGGHGIQNFIATDTKLVVGFDDPTTAVGALQLKLNPKGAEFTLVNIDGVVLDQGVIPCTGAAPDAAPPSSPQNVTAGTTATGSTLVQWGAAYDDTGVASYTLYRNGVEIATLGNGQLRYEDRDVAFNATYVYAVVAVDPYGKRSPMSDSFRLARLAQATLTLTPVADAYVDETKPATNFGSNPALRVKPAPSAQHSFLRFDVRGTSAAVTSALLRIYTVGGTQAANYDVRDVGNNTWGELTTTWNDMPTLGTFVGNSGPLGNNQWREIDVASRVQDDGLFSFGLSTPGSSAINLSSREGNNPPQLVIQVDAPPPPPPAAPGSLQATAPAAGRIELTWSAAASANGVETYVIRRDGALLTTVAGDHLAYTDTAVAPDTAYSYAVTAVNYSGAQSPASNTASVTTLPTPPTPLPIMTFTPVADAYVSSVQPNGNFGTSAMLRVDASPARTSYLRFDVQGLTGIVTRATLRLYALSGSAAGYEVHGVDGSAWAEGSVTYATRPGIQAGALGSNTDFAAGTWTSVDVTALIEGNQPLDLALIGLHPVGVAFYSRSSGDFAPQLVIEQIESSGAAGGRPSVPDALAAQAGILDTEPDADGDGVPDTVEALNNTNANAADSDQDGMSDLWEIETGLSPVSSASDNGAAGNPDGDGASNLDEYRADSDPFDATSGPPGAPVNARIYLPLVDR